MRESGAKHPTAARHPSPPLRGLYLITPDEHDTARLLARVQPLLPHATCLQYRNKVAGDTLRAAQAAALLPVCKAAGVPLVMNDNIDLAAAIGADGVHLGEHDGAIAAARARLGAGAIIGASCYGDFPRAERAAAEGATYIAFGAFFPSPTKPNARRASTRLLQDAARLGLPRVAIGGITPDNAPALVAAGADLLAVISGVFDADDPLQAARAYAACFNHPDPSGRTAVAAREPSR